MSTLSIPRKYLPLLTPKNDEGRILEPLQERFTITRCGRRALALAACDAGVNIWSKEITAAISLQSLWMQGLTECGWSEVEAEDVISQETRWWLRQMATNHAYLDIKLPDWVEQG